MHRVGVGYLLGIGVKQDQTEAVKWFRKAAELGNDEAQYSLGMCYNLGQGVPKDNIEAIQWLKKAAEQGHDKAQKILEKLGEALLNLSKDSLATSPSKP